MVRKYPEWLKVNYRSLRRPPKAKPILQLGFNTATLVLIFWTSIFIIFIAAYTDDASWLWVPFVVGIILYFFATSTKQPLTLEAFSKSNNFTFVEELEVDVKHDIGTIFVEGHDKLKRNVISGVLSDIPFDMYDYEYRKGAGKYESDIDAFVIELRLPGRLPHMIIDSKIESSNGGNLASTLPVLYDSSQKIVLEGDFNESFDTYAPTKQGVTLLTLLAPDVMVTLMDRAVNCDIEIKGDRLYFYWPDIPEKTSDYKERFSIVGAILDEVGNKLTRPSSLISRAEITTESKAVHAHESGFDLKAKPWWQYPVRVLLLLVVVLYLLSFYFPVLAGLASLASILLMGIWLYRVVASL